MSLIRTHEMLRMNNALCKWTIEPLFIGSVSAFEVSASVMEVLKRSFQAYGLFSAFMLQVVHLGLLWSSSITLPIKPGWPVHGPGRARRPYGIRANRRQVHEPHCLYKRKLVKHIDSILFWSGFSSYSTMCTRALLTIKIVFSLLWYFSDLLLGFRGNRVASDMNSRFSTKEKKSISSILIVCFSVIRLAYFIEFWLHTL